MYFCHFLLKLLKLRLPISIKRHYKLKCKKLHKANFILYIQLNVIKDLFKTELLPILYLIYLVDSTKNGDTCHECYIYSTYTVSRVRLFNITNVYQPPFTPVVKIISNS